VRDGCPFCDYEGPSDVLMDYGDCYVIEPLRQVTAGHVLVVPWVHVEDFAENPLVTGKVAARAAEWSASYGTPANLITSKGKEATQTVRHLHFHVLPRRLGDGLALPWKNPHERESEVCTCADSATAMLADEGLITRIFEAHQRSDIRPELAAALRDGCPVHSRSH
jgi:histidine triad (HIT) family protein